MGPHSTLEKMDKKKHYIARHTRKTKKPFIIKRAFSKAKRIVEGKASQIGSNSVLKHLEQQQTLLKQMDWDTLIVLDACRFDYFEQNYSNYFSGCLKKVCSPASWTYTWMDTMLYDMSDVTAYSCHPAINSMNIKRANFNCGRAKFKRIVDVWDAGYDKELKAMIPSALNKAVLQDIKDEKFTGKNLLWYSQPHYPFISQPLMYGSDTWLRIEAGEIESKVVQEAYQNNLRLVLHHVSELIPHLKGKTIITADHGELLGENGRFGHPRHLVLRELREVPWFEVE